MKTKITEFKCDLPKCRKKIKSVTEFYNASNFPYAKGWMYVHECHIKTRAHRYIKPKDCHFCCKEHLLKFLEQQIDSSLEKKK